MKDNREKERELQNFVTIDIETSGLDSSKDEIIRIEATKTLDGKNVDYYFSYVKSEDPLSEACEYLTCITNKMLENERIIDTVLSEFINFVGNLPIATSNKRFDISFLNVALKKLGKPLLDNEIIDL